MCSKLTTIRIRRGNTILCTLTRCRYTINNMRHDLDDLHAARLRNTIIIMHRQRNVTLYTHGNYERSMIRVRLDRDQLFMINDSTIKYGHRLSINGTRFQLINGRRTYHNVVGRLRRRYLTQHNINFINVYDRQQHGRRRHGRHLRRSYFRDLSIFD